MKTLARLIVAVVFLSCAVGSSLFFYIVGYAEGMGDQSRTVEPPTVMVDELAPTPQLQRIDATPTFKE